MHEILIKVGSNSHTDPEMDKECYKDGDIIHVTTPAESARVWNEMLANGRCTQQEYDDAQLSPGEFKWPWGDEEKKVHYIVVTKDGLTDEQVAAIVAPITSSVKTSDGFDILKIEKRREYKIDLNTLTYIDQKDGKEKTYTPEELAAIADSSITVEPDYEKHVPVENIEIKSGGTIVADVIAELGI